MIKNIIKEGIIIILLLIAIIFILSIVFYEYMPNNKTIPSEIQAYNLPEDMQQELKSSIETAEQQNIVKTLYIDNSDLKSYETKKDYNKGKANPFADYSSNESNTTNTNNNNNGTTSNNSNTTGTGTENSNKNEVYITTPGKNY